jgi:hypothetical protein
MAHKRHPIPLRGKHFSKFVWYKFTLLAKGVSDADLFWQKPL